MSDDISILLNRVQIYIDFHFCNHLYSQKGIFINPNSSTIQFHKNICEAFVINLTSYEHKHMKLYHDYEELDTKQF